MNNINYMEVEKIPADGSSQALAADSAFDCLELLVGFHQLPFDRHQLKHEFGDGDLTDLDLLLAARRLGLGARWSQVALRRLALTPLPALVKLKDGSYLLLVRYLQVLHDSDCDPGQPLPQAGVMVHRPHSSPEVIPVHQFAQIWDGDIMYAASAHTFKDQVSRLDFSWFIPSVIKYRKLFIEVLALSFILQIIALITPMFFQVVMDKVLVNNALKTMHVITIGLVMVTLFEVTMTAVRSYVFAHTTSKIDVELGSKIFKHLLQLPISYFNNRRTGDSITRVRELETIREFLTSNALTLVIDIVFSVVFFAVMFAYSVQLTLVVLASIPLYLIVSLVVNPVLRRHLDVKFHRGSENNSFLVESVGNMETLKASAVEPRWSQQWDKQLAGYVAIDLKATNWGMFAGQAVTLISKLTTVLIMWFGVQQVIGRKMTVGELIAFNMFASQVSTPILRLANLITDFQQVGISLQRLMDILRQKTEIEGHKTRLPELRGDIDIQGVDFRYQGDAPQVLTDVSISIKAGEMIGIVGRSGSGKSTLTKLVQRLYVPERGHVMIDGHDIAVIDTASLRRQIGVVLQDNNLFYRSIRDNIALAMPSASIEQIIEAAQLAGAHDFICELPEGYDTMVGEHGVGLSGGQRQRLAIARALLTNPRILIFDEATSALDYESERIIHDNMKAICQGRTVLVIAHRLSAVRHANRIVVMERGKIIEQGSHDALLEQKGIYSHLYRLQSEGSA